MDDYWEQEDERPQKRVPVGVIILWASIAVLIVAAVAWRLSIGWNLPPYPGCCG